MTRQNNNPWDEKWKTIKRLGHGGQGKTSLVEPKNLVDSSEHYVLKELNKQENIKCRKRMHREVSALKTLDCPGIAKLVDSNTENFDNLNIPLYMVTEFAPGKPLTLEFVHADGSKDTILANHSYNDSQIAWFVAGSALNLIAAEKA